MNFKQFLKEQEERPWMLKDKDAIKKWLKENVFDTAQSWVINDDLSVSSNSVYNNIIIISDINLVSHKGTGNKYLPIKFDKIRGGFSLKSEFIKDAYGLPNECRLLNLVCPLVYSFEHLPSKVDTLYLEESGITRWSGINEVIKECVEINISNKVKGGLLSFLKIKHLKDFNIDNISKLPHLIETQKIINKYLISHKPNIWQCQDELQDADLDEYADL